jgi:ubiquitin-conjugating enzyme E2 Q
MSSKTKTQRRDKRIMGEIKQITTEYNDVYDTINTSTGKIKLKMELQDDNIRHWRIYVHKDNFKNVDGFYKDLETMDVENIVFETLLPEEYPFAPPFIRIVKPIFITGSGYITPGGSMCMQILSTKGWNPASTMDQALVNIIQILMIGKARLNLKPKYKEYGLQEAQKYFKAVMKLHPEWNR